MKVTINTKQVEKLVEYMRDMERSASDLSVPLSDGMDLALADIRNAPSTSGASVGESWAPLAESTIERHGDHTLLNLTGSLIGSTRKFVRPFVAGVEATANHAILMERGRHSRVTIGEGGTQITRRHNPVAGFVGSEQMPARPFLRIRDEVVDQTVGFILDYITEARAA